jgi:hypothetical protein
MPRNLSLGRAGRPARSLGSIACLAFVVLVALTFWAGVAWLAGGLLAWAGHGF